MKKLFLLPLLMVAFVFIGCDSDDDKAQVVISFEGKLTSANSEFTTTDGVKVNEEDPYSYYVSQFKDSKNFIEFNHYYSLNQNTTSFGGGFTYTNKTDITTPDYTNNSAITGKGKTSQTYLTSNTSSFTPAKIKLLKTEDYIIKGVWITNSTYAYLVMKDGNDHSPAMDDDDWFKLTINGYDNADKKIGSIDFYLGDYRNGKKEIVKEWSWIDFSQIYEANYITFEMDGTVENQHGMSIPTYFCIDGITLEER